MSAYPIALYAGITVVVLFTYALGFRRGRARGIAEGWLERQQQLADSDKSRREKNGQFKGRAHA